MGENLAALLERGLPPRVVDWLEQTGRLAAARGESAYLVGGVVRDLFLGRSPGDLDVVVEGDALELARELVRRGIAREVKLHERFGTATVWLEDGLRVDVARCRTERYEAPAVLPQVAAASLPSDLGRRDFTVNALAVELHPDRFGRLVDPFEGKKDLEGGSIRALHERSFHDDPTRAFRAARYAARFRFRIASATRRAIRAAVRDGVFGRLSGSRLRKELELLFREEHPVRALRVLDRLGLLATIHRSLRLDRPLAAAVGRAFRLAGWVETRRQKGPVSRELLGIGVLFANLKGRDRKTLAERLRLSRRGTELLTQGPEKARALARALLRHRPPTPSEIHRSCRGHPPEQLLLAAAISGDPAVSRSVKLYLGRLETERPDVTGRDLLATGIAPGPALAIALEAALAAKLDGRARSRKKQWEVAMEAIRRETARETP